MLRVVKEMRKGWAGHVVHMVQMRNAYILVRKFEERDHFEDLGINSRVILNGC
jgi:hypothetical protein